MIDKVCLYLTNQIRKSMPEIDDERAEIINYGLQNIVGEIPKLVLLIIAGFLLGVGKYTILSFIILMPYKGFSGGFHLKTHLGCIIGTNLIYCGNALLSKYIIWEPTYIKYIIILLTWIFGMVMISLYAPADTEDVPVLGKKERKIKKIGSYISLTITLTLAVIIPDNTISNICTIGCLIQTITITKLAYKLTKNKYGYEVYNEEMATN